MRVQEKTVKEVTDSMLLDGQDDLEEEAEPEFDFVLWDRRMPPAGKVTWEEYVEWADTAFLCEWVNGEIIVLPPATNSHQMLQTFFTVLLATFVSKYDLGEVRVAPMPLHLPGMPAPPKSGREPDLLFITKERAHLIREHYIAGAPDIVVEIQSKSTRKTDHGAKYREYKAAGVREYWMADPKTQQARFYRLNANGVFESGVLEDGVFRSAVLPGFWLRVEWLWDAPLVRLHTILQEIGAV